MRMRTVTLISAVSIAALAAIRPVTATTPRFYADDPIVRAPEPQDAGGAAFSDLDLMYELTYNLFALPRHKPARELAQNLNTIDEVPDSSWFTNRIGTRVLSSTTSSVACVNGPRDPSRWTIWRKIGQPSWHHGQDAKGETWFLEFDPPTTRMPRRRP